MMNFNSTYSYPYFTSLPLPQPQIQYQEQPQAQTTQTQTQTQTQEQAQEEALLQQQALAAAQEQQNAQQPPSNSGRGIAGLALAALATAGIYFIFKGKGSEKAVENLKNMTMETFKKEGKFVKGKALTAAGENYTGAISQKLQDGKSLVREYTDGKLVKVTKKNGEEVLSTKAYAYDNDGVLKSVTDKDGLKLYETSMQNGYKVIKTPNVLTVVDPATGKIRCRANENSGMEFYDDKGKLADKINILGEKHVQLGNLKITKVETGKTTYEINTPKLGDVVLLREAVAGANGRKFTFTLKASDNKTYSIVRNTADNTLEISAPNGEKLTKKSPLFNEILERVLEANKEIKTQNGRYKQLKEKALQYGEEIDKMLPV